MNKINKPDFVEEEESGEEEDDEEGEEEEGGWGDNEDVDLN